MSLSCPTPREGWLSVLFFSLIASTAFYYSLSLPQEGKAVSPALRGGSTTEGHLHSPTHGRVWALYPSPAPASFTVWGETRFVSIASDPNSKSRHAKSLASAGSQVAARSQRFGQPGKTRVISTYGYPGDISGPASGFICAVPHKGRKRDNRWEWKRGTKLKLTNGKRSVVVVVSDVCNSRYWGKRVDLPREPYLALGGPSKPGLIHDVKVEVLK